MERSFWARVAAGRETHRFPARRAAVVSLVALSAYSGLGMSNGDRLSGGSTRVVQQPAAAATEPACTKYASTSGSNAKAGTATAPFRTVGYLMAHLLPGETGCLFPGTFAETVSIRTGGAPGSPVTLTSATATRAKIVGVFWVADSANDVVVTNLMLDGKTTTATPSPQVNGDRVTFQYDEVTNEHTGICFVLGGSFARYGRALATTIDHVRIHDCGRLPATNHDHGVYVEGATGALITNNWIYRNADWGVHLYPDARNTLVANNVIYGNGKGVIFAGDSSYASSGNVVRDNLITNSTIRYNAESWWGGDVGTSNLLAGNCLWKGKMGNVDQSAGGFSVSGNLVADPLYIDAAHGDFQLASNSPCVGKGPS